MDYTFNKTLLVILSLSSLLLSSNAVPSTRVIGFNSTSVPAAAPKSSKVDPEILKICVEPDENTTKHCIETLSKLFEGPFDVVKALEIEVNATLGLAKSLADTFDKLINDPSTNKTYIGALASCRGLCDDMLRAINQTLEVLPKQYFADAHNYMSSVISYNTACDINFEMGYPDAEILWDKEPLIQSTVICVDILYRIRNQP